MTGRIGVDVGGTFTDAVVYDGHTSKIVVSKTPTTRGALEQGVARALAEGGAALSVGSSDYFVHGTTVGLNSLLERSGAIVGLLATRGFRDVLELRRGDREDAYDLFWRQPPPLIPRYLRLPVTERILSSGQPRVPLNEGDVANAYEFFRDEGVEAIVIAFINSYVNPSHELAAAEILRSLGYAGAVSLSHVVSREYREYERTSTAVVDGYIKPRLGCYLRSVQDELANSGFRGEKLVTRSGGGAMTFAEAEARPFETLLSGPVGGAEGAADLCRRLELGSTITADVGGTSFDTCLVMEGRPQVTYEGRIAGMPLLSSWVDVRTIGAGGGSIAFADVGGLLRVGPRSAGAEPGPACYGRGGTDATVTDAALFLGLLGPGLLSGGLTLDRSRAEAALTELGEKLDYTPEEVARGVITIVTSHMADAIRDITVERGHDPREMTLMPFGGMGPLFGTLLARDLGVSSVVVPPFAGNFSAWGLLNADLVQEAARTVILRVTDTDLEQVNVILAELVQELASRREAAESGEVSGGLDMRLLGQSHTITVPIAWTEGCIAEDAERIRERFNREYQKAYGTTSDDEIEIVSVRATGRRSLPRTASWDPPQPISSRTHSGLPAYSLHRQTWLDFALVERTDITPDGISGPAIVLEETAATYLDAGFSAQLGPEGTLSIAECQEVR